MKLAIVIWVQDIKDWVLQQCINSLKSQTRKVDEIILAKQPKGKVTEFSRMSNIALRKTKSNYIGFIGGDTIFSKNSMEVIEQYFKEEPNSILTCARIDLSEESNDPKIDFVKDFDKWNRKPNHAGPILIMAPTKWYKKVGGFDERYIGWGSFDSDVVKRAKMDGLNQGWIENKGMSMLHIWHPERKSKDLGTIKRNEDIYYRVKDIKVNTNRKWGKPWKK